MIIEFKHVDVRKKPHIFKHKGNWVFLYSPKIIWTVANVSKNERNAQFYCRKMNRMANK